jgi:hypothetical protein
MAIAVVQVKGTQQSSAGDPTVTLDANVTAGNSVAVIVAGYSGSDVTYTVTDQASANAFTQASGEPYPWDNGFGLESSLFYLVNAPSGISGVKLATGGTALISAAIVEFSGGHTGSPTTGTLAKANSSSTTADSGTTTPAFDGSLIFGGGVEGSFVEGLACTHTLGSGFTVVFNGAASVSLLGIVGEYLIQTTAAAKSADWGLSRSTQWWSHVIAFRSAGIDDLNAFIGEPITGASSW